MDQQDHGAMPAATARKVTAASKGKEKTAPNTVQPEEAPESTELRGAMKSMQERPIRRKRL